MKTWHDLETYSTVPITAGAHAYAEKAEVLLWAYAVEDGPVKVWDVTEGKKMPVDLEQIVLNDGEMWWHNGGMFDRVVLANVMPVVYNNIERTRWRDTMVQALCHGLPGALGTLGDIFKLDANQAKDKRGRQLILMFCKPKKDGTRNTRLTHPVEWREFKEYAASDINAMRALHRKMPKWNYPNNEFELSLWQLDQKINMRGVCVDTILATKAIKAVNAAQIILAAAVREKTDGEVEAATQRDKLLRHVLQAHGVALPDLQASTLKRRIEDSNLPVAVRELLELRLQSATSSTSKYKRVIGGASADGRLRGLLQFSGASRTQRWAGRLFQPQNIMRPNLPQEEIDFGIEAIKNGCEDLITDNVMRLAANCMRGVVTVPPGKKLVVSDLSNIEGRAAAYLAGETWKIQAFRDFDAGIGPDLYLLSYANAFRVPVAGVTKQQRQIGKVMELAFAYGGGVGAWLTFAAAYNIDLDALTAQVYDTLPNDVRSEAENMYRWSIDTKRPTYGMAEKTFIVCDGLKRVWRRAHPAICSMWPALESAAKRAINTTETYCAGEHVSFVKNGAWLRMLLPSGDCLAYPAAKINDGAITYMGMNQYSQKWSMIYTYGGKLFENLCQKFARNIMAHNMSRIDDAGYQIVLTVHDELITEAPDNKNFTETTLSKMLAVPPMWAKEIPLAAAGFESKRYKKE